MLSAMSLVTVSPLRGLHAIVAALAMVAISATAQAQIVWDLNNPGNNPVNGYSITDITAGGGLRVGDKVFDQFDVEPSNLAGTPTPSQIFIKGFAVGSSIGLDFNSSWLYPGTGGNIVQNIEWVVTADTPFQIIGAEFDLIGYSFTNDGFISIVEDIDRLIPLPQAGIANLIVGASALSTDLFDSAVFVPGVTSIRVVKDIIVGSGTENPGTAELTRFTQTFVQVPEPGTLALAGAGLVLMGVRRRRQGVTQR